MTVRYLKSFMFSYLSFIIVTFAILSRKDLVPVPPLTPLSSIPHSTTPISLEQGDAPRHDSDDDEKGVYLDPYRSCPWVYVSAGDEAKVSY